MQAFQMRKYWSIDSHQWKIEVIFKQQKQYLGLKSLVIRSVKAIDRFLIILTLVWFYPGKLEFFSVGIHYRRRFRLFHEFAHLKLST